MNPITQFRSFALIVAAFCMSASASRAADLIPLGSSGWKYIIATQEPSTPTNAWRAVGFDDTSWSTGQTPIGYASPTDRVGYENSILTTIRTSATAPTWTAVYFRKVFNVSSLSGIASLQLNVYVDDGAVAWINGVEVGRANLPADAELSYTNAAILAEEERVLSVNIANLSMLTVGNNVLTVQAFNANTTSSDFHVEAALSTLEDTAPTAIVDPPPGARVPSLPFINAVFSESVAGVTAGSLLINGAAATSVATNNPNDYTFYFPEQPTGTVSVAWAPAHGIVDIDGPPTPFGGGSWSYTLDPNAIAGQFIISEFLAENDNGIKDEDGQRNDWIEIYNPSQFDASLAGWYLTDTVGSNLWRFPSHINMTLGSGNFLIVWASGKNRTNDITRLHTNFQLRRGGEYLALLNPAGQPVSEFSPVFPEQQPDESYGRDRIDPNIIGFFPTPTPGAANTASGAGYAPEPIFSIDSGVFTNNSITVSITLPPGVSGEIRYVAATGPYADPTQTNNLYSGPLTISTNVAIKARVFVPGLLPGPVVSRSYTFLDASTRDFNSNLPILILSTSGRAIPVSVPPGGQRVNGTFAVFDTFRGRSAMRSEPDYIGLAAFEVFGQTSAGWAKVPHNIELLDNYGGDKNASILGFPEDADWKLRNPFSDKCLMNDFLGYELFEEMGNYSVGRKFVEVFIDSGGGKVSYPGDYYGVMVFMEKIEQDKNRVNIQKLTPAHTTEPEITGGYMWKKDKDSTGDLNFSVAGANGFAAQALKMHEPKPRDLTTAQFTWIRNYLAQMSTALYATDWLTRTGTNHYSYYLDVDNFVNAHWLVEFTKQIDGYRLSNYMQKDRNGKAKMAPVWDWNLSFGNADYLEGGMTNGWYWNIQQQGMTSAEHIWLRRLLYGAANIVGNGGVAATTTAVINSGDPEFIQKAIDRWGQLRTNVMNGPRLTARIDEIASILTDGGQFSSTNTPVGRNYAKYTGLLGTYFWPNPTGPPTWPINYATTPTYAGIISEMKKWTSGRFAWIDSQIVRAPLMNRSSGSIAAGDNVTISAPAGGTLYYTLNGTDPRLSGGNVSPAAQIYTGTITLSNNVQVFARARIGTNQYSWSPPAIASLHTTIPGLRITEVMYHPANPPQPSSFTDEDFEYIELRNTTAGSLNIGGYKLRGGIDFVFPNMTLAAGERVVVVKNALAFTALYGPGIRIAGEFGANNLDNTGERLVLEGNLGEPILDFRYDDDWYKITDGLGFALVIANDQLPPAAWSDPANWRVGGQVNGTPGTGEPAPTVIPNVIISEVLTHTDFPALDTIELQNRGTSPADISGWYISDDRLDIKKFRVPNGTVIPVGGFVTFNENNFGTNGTGPRPFALSSTGDEVYLASVNGDGELTGYLHGFSFGPQINGVTFGRYVTSLQQERFVSQSANTLNGANSGPLIGNIVVSEFNYHPQEVFANGAYWNNSEDEFIELYNRGGSTVNLYHSSNSNITWRLDKAVEFEFPPGTSIPAGGYLVLVNFNPTTKPSMAQAFRAKFNVPAQVPLLGPLQGDLGNGGETVALYQPDTPFTNQNNFLEVPYVLVEEVEYSDAAPWPLAADGAGFSMHRRNPIQYSDDPINWESSSPTPGRGYTPGPSPTINSQPQNTTAVENNLVTLSVTAGGAGPFRYQWRKDGNNLNGQTNTTLTFSRVNTTDSGNYQVLVMNNTGSTVSSNAELRVLIAVRIDQHPVALTVRPPTNVVFTVVATSSSPIRYQWFFNNNILPGQTNSSLSINNVTNVHEGDYYVVCTDTIGPVPSLPARLTVLINPIMLSPSPADPLRITAVSGETLNLSAQLHGTLPIFSRWRLTRNSGGTVTIGDRTNQELFSTVPMLVSNTSAGRVLLSLTNISGGSLATTAVVTNAILTVLADTDGDGVPDVYESANGMNPNDPADANVDSDGDTMKNKAEYIAGTDPRNASSYLKVDQIATIGSAIIYFSAVSNRSYTVEYSDTLTPAPAWQHVGDVAARTTNWVGSVVDPSSSAARFYRLVTPATP